VIAQSEPVDLELRAIDLDRSAPDHVLFVVPAGKRLFGLLLDFRAVGVDRFAAEHRARIVIRGLRAVSDFEFEFQMALMNQTLDPELETLFMMPSSPFTFLSSSLVKEVFGLGGEVGGLVPGVVERRLREKFRRTDASPNTE
jgi:hypothetical protein